jgi:hypothetical protein
MKYFLLPFFLICGFCGHTQTLIPSGSVWKYYDQGDVGTPSWKDNNFDDSAWASGNAELGYGDGDEATVVSFGPDANNKYITTYFRKMINLTEQRSIDFQIKMDDGAVVYLNGTEVYRIGMTSGIIGHTTLASSNADENQWHTFSMPQSESVIGNNIIAVEIHQATSTSSDISLDFEATIGTLQFPPLTGILVNEIMASNSETATDQAGESSDWIEIFNSTANTVDLNGYYFTDDITELTKMKISGGVAIPANQRAIIWASGEPQRGVNHLNFSLSAEGEFIALVHPDGETIVDSISFGKQGTDVSFGRETDGAYSRRFFSPASFNSQNKASDTYLGILEPPHFSHESGFFQNSFDLSLSSPNNATIYYTDDSSEPTPSDLNSKIYNHVNQYAEFPNQSNGSFITKFYRTYQYQTPVSIIDKTSQGIYYAGIATTYDQNPNYFPSNNHRIHTIKAVASKPGYLDSDVISQNYIVNGSGVNPSALPTIFIQCSPEELFGHNDGIYLPGQRFFNWRIANPNSNAQFFGYGNWWDERKRLANFEMFEGETSVVKRNVGISIGGTGSKAFRTKSLKIYTGAEFGGGEIDYKLFPGETDNSFNTIVLRNSGSNVTYSPTYLKDGTLHKMIRGLNTDFQRFRPAAFYLNGEYWGILNIRDRADFNSYERVYGVKDAEIERFKNPFTDNWTGHYDNTKNYIRNNDMTDMNKYSEVKKLIDVSNLIDYIIIESFAGNEDWPENNIAYWRKVVPYDSSASVGQDGRWRWTIYDLDWSRLTINPYQQANSDRLLYKYLKPNEEFKNQFVNRYADVLNSYFMSGRTTAIVDSAKNQMQNEMINHIARWRYPNSIADWNNSITDYKNGLINRKTAVLSATLTEFNISGDYDLTVNVSNQTAGYVHVNSIDILPSTPGIDNSPYPWTGEYFDNIPLQIHARPNIGYKFKHWEYNGITITDSVLTLNTSSNVSYKAVFEEDLLSENPLPVAFDVDKCGYSFKFWDTEATVASFPASMGFVYMDQPDPTILANVAGFTSGDYDSNSRTRVNGLGENGVSFINTGSSRDGYPETRVGGAILSLNTSNFQSLNLAFTAGTVVANSREYNLRLQYRIGDKLPFIDLLDENNQVVEYTRSANNGHEQQFEVNLPNSLLGKPYVQLFWRYYYTETRNSEASGARDEIRLDDIKVKAKLLINQPVITSETHDKYTEITTQSSIETNTNLTLEAGRTIILKPGFSTGSQTIFTATVTGCPE